jgi:DNA-directed RNA polymerase subunit alpha
VEHTRVGQVTDYDRLILEVWTDGTTPPDEAVAQGSQILIQQFSLFTGLTRSQAALAPAPRANGSSVPSAIADMPIEDLDLPQRAFNSLKRHGITKVGQLLQTPDEELLRMRNFGKKSLDEIKERLAARGLIEPPEPSELSADSGDESQSDDVDDTAAEDETTPEGEETAAIDGDDEIVADEQR